MIETDILKLLEIMKVGNTLIVYIKKKGARYIFVGEFSRNGFTQLNVLSSHFTVSGIWTILKKKSIRCERALNLTKFSFGDNYDMYILKDEDIYHYSGEKI